MGNTICKPQVWNWLRNYTEQINYDVGYKWGCCTKRLQQQETLSVSLCPATRGGFSPSPHPGRWVPWTAFSWQWWIAAFIRSHSVQKSMHAFKNVAPLCQHTMFPRTKCSSQLHPLQRVQTQDVHYIANLHDLLNANFKEIWTDRKSVV